MLEKMGILHPGEMGISIAAAAKSGGCIVYWASEGRSPATTARAQAHGLIDLHRLDVLCSQAEVILSVCPPAAAEAVAQSVRACGFAGLYVDANAISPGLARQMGSMLVSAGISFVDAGIIGGPAWKQGTTWLHLSGEEAGRVAKIFREGPLETNVIGGAIGTASALKMCYAAYTKGTSSLLAAVLGAAEAHGVREVLEMQWALGDSDFVNQTHNRIRRVTKKAWRFEGELDEIAETFEEAGMPGGFHRAGAEIYRRIAGFKDADELPSIERVLEALLTVS